MNHVRVAYAGDKYLPGIDFVPHDQTGEDLPVRSMAFLKEDVYFNKPGHGNSLYAPKGTPVQVMVWDPQNVDKPYGIRAVSEQYRNVQVPTDVLSKNPVSVEGL